jgi:hypothetical protein
MVEKPSNDSFQQSAISRQKIFSFGLKADRFFLKLPDRFAECKDRPHLRGGGVR